jgi:hypothetical protein
MAFTAEISEVGADAPIRPKIEQRPRRVWSAPRVITESANNAATGNYGGTDSGHGGSQVNPS